MVLQPLEFSDCFLDSPWFRSGIKEHEDELEKTNSQIKLLIKDAKAMLVSFKKQCETMHTFSDRLKNFQFDIIGTNLTDAERGIAGFLKEFGSLIEEIEGEWSKTIERSEIQLIDPLEKFRKDHIHSYREAKKTFDKCSDRYYKQMEQTLGLSHKKKDILLKDSDEELHQQKKNFHQASLNYIYKLQEVQERKKFEFVEHLLMFMQIYTNFLHQTHETAADCKEYMSDIQRSLVSTRSQYEGTRDKTKTLMQKMMENPSHDTPTTGSNSPQHLIGHRWTRAGYLFLSEKNALGSRFTAKWSRFFCMYTKENKLFQMTSPMGSTSFSNPTSSIKANHSNIPAIAEPLIVMSCTRRATESIDKRFCFDIEVQDTAGKQSVLTLQAISSPDRNKWLSAMDGKEPDYILSQDHKKPGEFVLNNVGMEFVENVIAEIERRGVDAEGIYRLVGVSSRVERVMQLMMDPKSRNQINIQDEVEWEMTTLTSALKNFFRNLPEPIMTFELHDQLIAAAKKENPEERLQNILDLVSKLSPNSKKVLKVLLAHLVKVAAHSQSNKMPVQNIGVCFGPTLMRPKQETVQSIMEIKFNNIIVEILIENYEPFFVHGSLQGVVEKSHHKRGPVDSRPSMRLKARPARHAVSQYENVPSERQAPNSGEPQLDASPKFQRGHAIRAVPKKRSPRLLDKVYTTGEKEDSSLSDNTSDELGRISPLDLNLSLEFPTSRASNIYMNAPQSFSVKAKSSKESYDIRRARSHRSTHSHSQETEAQSKNENFNNSSDVKSDEIVSSSKDGIDTPSTDEIKPSMLTPKRRAPNVLPKTSVVKKATTPSQNKPGTFMIQSKHLPSSTRNESNATVAEPLYTKPIKREHHVSGHHPIHKPTELSSNELLPVQRPRASAVSSRYQFSPTQQTIPVTTKRAFVALYSCEAEHESELSFEPGDIIYDVVDSDEPGWLIGTLDGVSGLIPANYVEEAP